MVNREKLLQKYSPNLVPAAEAKPVSLEFRPFTTKEKEALTKDGAVILNLTGVTDGDLKKAGSRSEYIAHSNRLLKAPSIKIEVAIFPDPERFFVPNSSGKDLAALEELAEKDGQELRKRLDLEDDSLSVIIPDQTSIFKELAFRYLNKTAKEGKEVLLFGEDYGYRAGIIKINDKITSAVGVNRWDRVLWPSDIYVVRLVAARKR